MYLTGTQKWVTEVKKNAALFKIFYIISPQWEHCGTYFKQIQEATLQGYNFHFLLFLDIGHVTNNPTTHYMNPDRYNHSHLVFLHFLVKLSEISFLGYMHRTLTWTLKAMPHCTYMICSIPIFFLIFLIFFSFETPEFPFLDIYPGLCKHQPTILITIPIFFIIFSLFF